MDRGPIRRWPVLLLTGDPRLQAWFARGAAHGALVSPCRAGFLSRGRIGKPQTYSSSRSTSPRPLGRRPKTESPLAFPISLLMQRSWRAKCPANLVAQMAVCYLGAKRKQMGHAGERTITDFGEQFTHYHDNEGYFGSAAFLANMLGPLLSIERIKGARVAEIGSGAGRVVGMLLEAGAAYVTALEPSDAFHVLQQLFGERQNVTFIRQPGDKLPPTADNDFVFCLGVMQFIPQTTPVVRAAKAALKPGGKFIVRVYSKEGNQTYLALLIYPLRLITPKLPHTALAGLVRLLDLALVVYLQFCKVLPLPMRDYFLDVVAKLSPASRRLTIYDQLNPSYVRYYSRHEAETLLGGEFENIRLYHHRETTWTIIGTKPGE